ncbi:MAG: hypothetical protein ACOYK8_06535 [Alphaproteobacteria bacterium]
MQPIFFLHTDLLANLLPNKKSRFSINIRGKSSFLRKALPLLMLPLALNACTWDRFFTPLHWFGSRHPYTQNIKPKIDKSEPPSSRNDGPPPIEILPVQSSPQHPVPMLEDGRMIFDLHGPLEVDDNDNTSWPEKTIKKIPSPRKTDPSKASPNKTPPQPTPSKKGGQEKLNLSQLTLPDAIGYSHVISRPLALSAVILADNEEQGEAPPVVSLPDIKPPASSNDSVSTYPNLSLVPPRPTNMPTLDEARKTWQTLHPEEFDWQNIITQSNQ